MKMWCLSAYPQGSQYIRDFSKHKGRFLTQTVAVYQVYNGSQWDSRLWEREKHTQTKPNETLRLVTRHWCVKTRNNRFVQETEQYLYRSLTSDLSHRPTVLRAFTTVFWLYGRSQTYKCICLLNKPLTRYLSSQLGDWRFPRKSPFLFLS